MSHRNRPGRGWETLIAVLAALAAGAAGGYFLAGRGTPSAATADKPAAKPDRVTALARLQPAGGVVPVYGPPGDRIAKLHDLPVGTILKKDETPIAELESFKERDQEVRVARIQLAEAKAESEAAQTAGNQKIAAARAELNQAKANKDSDLAAIDAKLAYLEYQAEVAATQRTRLTDLRKNGVTVAAEDVEKAELLARQAAAELKATQALRQKTATTYAESEKAAAAKIRAARAELAAAVARVPLKSSEERLKLAEQIKNRTTLKAPITGTVLKVTGRDGQPTGVEPILHMADLTAMTAVAEVYESDVGRLNKWLEKGGTLKAEVKNPALPDTLRGTVTSEQAISRMIARNQVFAVGPREDADRRVVEVVVHLAPEAAEVAGRFVGLQVTVTLEPNK